MTYELYIYFNHILRFSLLHNYYITQRRGTEHKHNYFLLLIRCEILN